MPEAPISILVVDDEEDARRNLADILTDLGYQTAMAEDGESALQIVRSMTFDIALLDFKMPGMNGLELFRAIRRISPETIAIVVSAFTEPSTRAEALSMGVTDVLRKPVDLPALLTLIERFASQPLVLVIDDDPDCCRSLWDLLSSQGYRVGLAHDLSTAEEKISSRQFKLILIDLRLPDGRGTDLAREVQKNHPDTRTVLISGEREELDSLVQSALGEGAGAVCYKPFDVPRLLKLIATLTSQESPRT